MSHSNYFSRTQSGLDHAHRLWQQFVPSDWSLKALCLLLAARRSGARTALCNAAVVASIVLGNHNTVTTSCCRGWR